MKNRRSTVSSKRTHYVHYRLFLHEADNPATSLGGNDAAFVPLSCLTRDSGAEISKSSNGITGFVFSCTVLKEVFLQMFMTHIVFVLF